MNIGMLWFDNVSKPTCHQVQRARLLPQWYGRTPNVCLSPRSCQLR
jgi:hypothetical protein